MRLMHPLQLQADCNIVPVSSGGFHQLSIDTTIMPLAERTELSEAECDVDTLKKLKLGLRSTLWSRPASTTSQMGRQSQPQQQTQSQQPQQQQPSQRSQKQQPQRQQNSPAPTPKLLTEKSDYSISV